MVGGVGAQSSGEMGTSYVHRFYVCWLLSCRLGIWDRSCAQLVLFWAVVVLVYTVESCAGVGWSCAANAAVPLQSHLIIATL